MKSKRKRHDLLLDGERLRVPLFAMDGMQRDVRQHFACVTDGRGNSGLVPHRPGFRYILDDAAGMRAKEVAYRRADAEMVNAWRNPPTQVAGSRVCAECDGSGLNANGEGRCPACDGTGVVDADPESKADAAARNAETHHVGLLRRGGDSRSVDQITRDHQANMARIYEDHDRKLSEAWRDHD